MAQTKNLCAQTPLDLYAQVYKAREGAGYTIQQVQTHPDNGVLRSEEEQRRADNVERQRSCDGIPVLRAALQEDQSARVTEGTEDRHIRTELVARSDIDSLPEFCSPADLSLILPVSRATLYRMAEQKRIPSVRIGRRVLIPREIFKKWMEQECAI